MWSPKDPEFASHPSWSESTVNRWATGDKGGSSLAPGHSCPNLSHMTTLEQWPGPPFPGHCIEPLPRVNRGLVVFAHNFEIYLNELSRIVQRRYKASPYAPNRMTRSSRTRPANLMHHAGCVSDLSSFFSKTSNASALARRISCSA